ncbi:acyl-ACP thioesterase domain-containing protein [Leptospira stimsonii]|uniref:Acyl-ACP thioesterase-like C-terminal domain-containing protein n=1 Tax=Leptospira stimsonii TaxID=2202203 RepID=A0A4R9L7G3_9LEPT|nr:hypothetical protein DLM78_23280 [Leptospira stimsonii]TGK23356.1 hypothetical protein EHO98_05445 [Leptospira stimsonii]TGM20997.1 hypothetical protein EHQ90_02515 [Leptospira stimsonii]
MSCKRIVHFCCIRNRKGNRRRKYASEHGVQLLQTQEYFTEVRWQDIDQNQHVNNIVIL